VAATLTVGALGLAACGSDPDALPTVASVNFEPRLVVVADADGIRAEAGDREGARELDGSDADWSVPDGSVVLVRVEGSTARRVVGQRTEADGDDPSFLLDTGELQPGDDVTVALTEPGRVDLAFGDDDATLLTISVEPR
jgi:hypothetical protein